MDGVIARMTAAWETLDRSCAFRAVFALTYLRTTERFRAWLDEVVVDDEPWIIRLDRIFADLYFDAAEAPDPASVSPSWRIAFAAADGRRTSAGQDVLLGMNAHIQRDLPFALWAAGLAGGASGSHKPDHDRVNEMLASIIDPVQDEIADRYDETMRTADASPSPAEETGTLELIRAWREEAWRNAERLADAAGEADRALVAASIEANAEVWARAIAAPDATPAAGARDARCRSYHDTH